MYLEDLEVRAPEGAEEGVEDHGCGGVCCGARWTCAARSCSLRALGCYLCMLEGSDVMCEHGTMER